MPTPEHSRPAAAVCGLLVPLTGKSLFLLLCAGYLGSALGFAALQEKVFDIPGFKFSGWMTFVTAATMAICGMLERLLTRDLNRVGTLAQYAALSVLTVSGMGLTNLSLNYLTYPTRVIFKSSKLLPTMAVGQPGQRDLARSSPGGHPLPQKPRCLLGVSSLGPRRARAVWIPKRGCGCALVPGARPEVADPTASDPPPPSTSLHLPPPPSTSLHLQVGTLLLGRKYSFLEYVASAGLVTGIVFFTMGDAEARPSLNSIGIVLLIP